MEINYQEKYLLDKISIIISNYYQIKKDFYIHKNSRYTNVLKGSYIFIYIIHVVFNISIKKLELYTHRSKRSIFRNSSNAKLYISMYSEIKKDYENIMNIIKEEDTIKCPLQN